jgi:hypothetical protein
MISKLRHNRVLETEGGFTMIIAIGVMFVTSLILVAAFTVANGDVQNSHVNAAQKQAYYAALAGVQQYEYLLQANPDYWQTCGQPESKLPEEAEERYVVTPLVASTAPVGTKACSTENPFGTMIETKGTIANTFRIKSTGYAGGSTKSTGAVRSVIATFRVTGFLDYVFYTNFETVDPNLYSSSEKSTAEKCANKYYSEWSKEGLKCSVIEFGEGDEIEGPMHTNDAADVTGDTRFGREGHVPTDVVEINGGTYGSQAGCSSTAKYFTATKCYIKGPTLTPPPDDTSLAQYVESAYEYVGQTWIELKGEEMEVTTYNQSTGVAETKKGVKLPPNGLIYVTAGSGTCNSSFNSESADSATEQSETRGCATVYVKGAYKKSLTVAGEKDVVVTGSLYPSSVEGKLGTEPENTATKPTGTAVLGLIASRYVRVYHPCSSNTNQTGSFENPWIYAAILATSQSWIADNPGCGAREGHLNVYGAIGQNYRGIVLHNNGGYIKNYEYDDRLATDEPPYFLAPLKAGWKVVRETAPAPG